MDFKPKMKVGRWVKDSLIESSDGFTVRAILDEEHKDLAGPIRNYLRTNGFTCELKPDEQTTMPWIYGEAGLGKSTEQFKDKGSK